MQIFLWSQRKEAGSSRWQQSKEAGHSLWCPRGQDFLAPLLCPGVASGTPFDQPPDSLAFLRLLMCTGYQCSSEDREQGTRWIRPTCPSPVVVTVACVAPLAWVPRRQALTQGCEVRACWGGPAGQRETLSSGHDRGLSRPHRTRGWEGCRNCPKLGRRGLVTRPATSRRGLSAERRADPPAEGESGRAERGQQPPWERQDPVLTGRLGRARQRPLQQPEPSWGPAPSSLGSSRRWWGFPGRGEGSYLRSWAWLLCSKPHQEPWLQDPAVSSREAAGARLVSTVTSVQREGCLC